MRRALPVLLTLAALVLGACGSSDSPGTAGHVSSKATPVRPPADPAAASVIRAWAHALQTGDVHGAAALFARDAVVVNGGSPVRLKTPGGAILFNLSLPCGARVVSIYRYHQYTAATFVLGERAGDKQPPSARCGSGVGLKAATAFVIRGGKILQWIRLDNPPPAGGGGPPPPLHSSPSRPEV